MYFCSWLSYKTVRLLSAFTVLCALSLTVNDAAAECQVDTTRQDFARTDWYGLYWDKAKAGHLWTRSTVHDDGKIELNYRISITIGGIENLTSETRHFDASPPHQLLSGTLLSNGQTINYQKSEQGLSLQSGEQNLNWPSLNWQLCNEGVVAIRRALETALKPGDQFETQYLDIEAMNVVDEHHTIESIETRTVLGKDHRFQTFLTGATIEGMATKYRQRYRDGNPVTVFLGQLEARLETKTQALSPIQDTEALDVLTLPTTATLELSRLNDIAELEVSVTINDSLATIQDVVKDGVMQRVTYLNQQSATVRIADYPPLARSKAAAREDPVSNHLIANLVYPADHPRIKAIASKIRNSLPSNATDRDHAEAILHHTAESLQYELTATASVLETLDTKIGDCTEYARLFVTLARASGFPAREVSGFIYTGTDYRGEVGGHAWVEVFVDDQWQPMDPTSNEVRPNKSHIQLSNFLVTGLGFDILNVSYKPR